MAQPPPRKGAYAKFVVNLHREQFNKLQAKNQQELDLLDDLRPGEPCQDHNRNMLKMQKIFLTPALLFLKLGANNARSHYCIYHMLLTHGGKVAPSF
jgi:hypothetical protein